MQRARFSAPHVALALLFAGLWCALASLLDPASTDAHTADLPPVTRWDRPSLGSLERMDARIDLHASPEGPRVTIDEHGSLILSDVPWPDAAEQLAPRRLPSFSGTPIMLAEPDDH